MGNYLLDIQYNLFYIGKEQNNAINVVDFLLLFISFSAVRAATEKDCKVSFFCPQGETLRAELSNENITTGNGLREGKNLGAK